MMDNSSHLINLVCSIAVLLVTAFCLAIGHFGKKNCFAVIALMLVAIGLTASEYVSVAPFVTFAGIALLLSMVIAKIREQTAIKH